ncbi:85/88 kDa calcium-independent phospholipase A2-like [Culicoides brevitarsis]|uniref:85/88 kDa calcium-independent phospholipase A2-like n=1 Tax=Culicoides brevitarsis TaxID=469753 RepID=UPI00307B1AE2
MAWLGFGALATGAVLHRILGGETPPNKVQEIKTDGHGSLTVLLRDDNLILYGPSAGQGDRRAVYEIILHRPYSEQANVYGYSLYRAQTLEDAEEKFNLLFQRLPAFVAIVKDMYNVNGLQKICDALIENQSWSLTHLVAYFNLTQYLMHPTILENVDLPDHVSYMTPLQLAIKSNNIEMVKVLLPLVKLEHLDINSNSIYHFAAETTKELINLLAAKSTENLNHLNSDGYTPLHLACIKDKPECVKALLLAGADVNITAKHNNVTNKTQSSANRSPPMVANGTVMTERGPQVNRTNPGSVADFLQNNQNKLFTSDMKYGGTPLHWSSSREVLSALINRNCDVNALNFNQQTALHVMVSRERLDCVVCLLSHEAEINLKDKDGNTALHIAVEKKNIPIVQALVVFGCDIDMPNHEGKTPRHMVGKDANGTNDDMILYILHSVGAKRCSDAKKDCPPGCNATGTYNGIPPAQPETMDTRDHIQTVLQSTSKNRKESVMNALNSLKPKEDVSFVDITPEQKGASVMDALLSMFTGKVAVAKCDAATSSSRKSTPTTPSPSTSKVASTEEEPVVVVSDDSDVEMIGAPEKMEEEKPFYGKGRLLCLDGGGIRGLILVQLLLEIERLSQTPINHMFDWIAGTSTGGILALGLGCGKTMMQCMCLYLRMKEIAFVGSRPYPSDPLEQVLKDNLGEFTVMSDIKHPKLMVTGVMADRKPVDLHLFRNYKCASEILGIVTATSNRRVPPPPPDKQLLWRAARATGAAPSYFRAFGRFLDGGLIANNPTLDAMTEIHEYNMALQSVGREKEVVPLSVVVSLGTGLIPVTELKEIDVFRPDSIWDTAKLAYGISALGNLLVDQATASDGRVVDRARAWCSMIGVPYFRFNPQMSVDVVMDEKSDAVLMNMLWEAKAYMHANRNKIMEMINLLK